MRPLSTKAFLGLGAVAAIVLTGADDSSGHGSGSDHNRGRGRGSGADD